ATPHTPMHTTAFFLNTPRPPPLLPSFPTRRSSDLVKVLDVTNLARPGPVAHLPLDDAQSIYLARTYAYVAAGKNGLVILDIQERSEEHTSELQSPYDLVCRLLLEKKKTLVLLRYQT